MGFKARGKPTGWLRLTDLPEQRLLDKDYPSIVYWEVKDGVVWHQGRRLRGSDPATFEVRTDEEYKFLGRDRSYVYHAWSKLPKLDRATFELLTDNYCKDKNLAYCTYETSLQPLKGRTLKNFQVLGRGFARDAVHAYYWGKPLRSCTAPLTFALVNGGGDRYARDREQIYCEAAVLKGADAGSWHLLSNGFSRDISNIFYDAKRLAGVDLASWQQLSGPYSRDDKRVYMMWWRVKGADPNTFRPPE